MGACDLNMHVYVCTYAVYVCTYAVYACAYAVSFAHSLC
jgi:hypothetical protein